MRPALLGPLFAIALHSSAFAATDVPPPIPPNTVALAKARELLAVMNVSAYIQYFSPEARERMIGRLVDASIDGQPHGASADYAQLLHGTFALQIRDKTRELLPEYLEEVAEMFARLQSRDEIDGAIAFYKSSIGKRHASALFATMLNAPQFENRVVAALLNDAPMTAGKVMRSEETMHKINAKRGDK
ncbi:hypothetical protein [Sphingomonas sp.]|uniref:hypothetical protein n=1 Tax=Sphingomonas sp. TaxID=28214 RepID=UPI003D6D0A63